MSDVIELKRAAKVMEEFAQNKVPMIGYCQPELLSISNEQCETRIPLNAQTQNHLQCLYFGALAVGADITGGFLAMWLSQQTGHNVELLFKDFKADFKRRAVADTHFYCGDGELIQTMIASTVSSGERVNKQIRIVAMTPSISDDVVGEFELTLGLKYKDRS